MKQKSLHMMTGDSKRRGQISLPWERVPEFGAMTDKAIHRAAGSLSGIQVPNHTGF